MTNPAIQQPAMVIIGEPFEGDAFSLNADHLALIENWKSLGTKDTLPTWSTDLLLEMPDLVPDLMVLQVIDDSALNVIYHGSKSVQRVGKDFTGKDYLKTSRSEDASVILPTGRILHSVPCASLSIYRILQRQWKDYYYTVTTLSLPFVDGSGGANNTIVQNHMTTAETRDTKLAERSPADRADKRAALAFVDIGYGLPESDVIAPLKAGYAAA